jgi:ATP synthase regulation protein NCA2
MMTWRSFKTLFILIGFSLIFTPIQSIPTKSKLLIVPQRNTIRRDKLQTANKKGTYIATDFQAMILELLDILYEHANYWQKKQAQATKTIWKNQTNAALDCIYNEIDYQAMQLATVTEWLTSDEQTRNKINLIMPYDCKTYKKEVLDRISPYKIPSHLSQHWIKYSISAACTIGAIAYCHHNKELLAAIGTKTKKSAQDFFRDYAYKPLRNSYNIIFGQHQEKPLISPSSIKQEEEMLQRMMEKSLTINNPSGKSPEGIREEAQKAVLKRDLPQDIADKYTEESQNPVRSLTSPWGQLGRLGMILGHLKALRLIDIIQDVDDLRQANRLNLELMVAIPTALGGYGTYRALKGIYRFVHPAEKNYAPIKRNVLNIERALNIFNNAKQTFTHAKQGKIIYWIHKLSKLEYLVPVEQREIFFADLAELYAPDLSVKQKLRTIDRMYRTFSFLCVSAVS